MRPMVVSYSGPTSPLPVDKYVAGYNVNITISGTGTLQSSNDDPFNPPPAGFVWNTISPGNTTSNVQSYRMASGVGVVTIVQQGTR